MLGIFLALPEKARAAACCGGGFAAPSLIAGDDLAIFTASYAYTAIKKDVYPDGLWRNRDFSESSQTIKLEGAHIFFDRFQAGVSLPVVIRTRQEKAAVGLGDTALTMGYEYLTDWDYNPWRPRALGYLQLVAPTGRAIQEAGAVYQLDSRGRGFWALGIGTLLTKAWGNLDVFSSLDVRRSFAREYANAVSAGRLVPGWGGGVAFGAGYSLGEFRLGPSLNFSYEDPIRVEGTAASRGAPERYATFILAASYLMGDSYAATLSYSDQTLFGSPVNTRLGRGIAIQLQRRWAR
ncbi:MAG: serine protease spb1 [Proteobacteria bacterium]|nr:MAG: serine protease spb1 [Pseudomonadota bacterium]